MKPVFYSGTRGLRLLWTTPPQFRLILKFNFFLEQVRSSIILEASAEYFVEHIKNLNTPQINSIAKVFGNLNIHPSNGFKFWDKLETILEQKFAEFPPKDLIELMLSFIYIEKFPVNLAHRIFNPNFLDRIESCKNPGKPYKENLNLNYAKYGFTSY